MKILIATPLLPTQTGGPAHFTVGLSDALRKGGHEVTTIAFQSVARYPTGIRHLLLFFLSLFKALRVDAVIVLDTLSMALPVSMASLLCRRKCVIRVGGDFVWEQYIERTHDPVLLSEFYNSRRTLSLKEATCLWLQKNIIFRIVDALAFTTVWQRNLWEAPYALQGKQTCIIENALPLAPRAQPSPVQALSVVWMGRDIALKNVSTLDEAVARVKVLHPAVTYRKYSSLPHDELVKILGTSRVLAIPSFSEVSPNLALEAIALHVPVLLTRDCGMHEVFGEAVTWIDSRSVEDVASNLAVLMTDAGYHKARERAASFNNIRTFDQVANEFLELFRSA